jgi:hypothetical protein
VSNISPTETAVPVLDNHDGTFKVLLTPEVTGKYEISLHLRRDGKEYPVKGSPFRVKINVPEGKLLNFREALI